MESIVRTSIRFLLLPTIIAGMVFNVPNSVQAKWIKRIPAERGKPYHLRKQHGPTLIMVATFRRLPGSPDDGMSPEEAAHELVYELRKKGLPAYTYTRADTQNKIQTRDRLGRRQRRKYIDHQGSIAVLAGNYASLDEKLAQKTLNDVKRFHPKFLRNVKKSDRTGRRKLKNGGVYLKTSRQSGPLSGAFLTVNPLLSPDEVHQKKRSPLLRKLNSGTELSLLQNPGKYSLVVASFYGTSATQVPNKKFRGAAKRFKVGNSLNQAAVSAWELAQALRKLNIEAWVFHDRYKSVVTVGSFQTPTDPRIPGAVNVYKSKMKEDPRTRKEVLVAETLTMPLRPKPNEMVKRWIFDPYPKLMEVPKL